jgi:RHS repeat-associated protein
MIRGNGLGSWLNGGVPTQIGTYWGSMSQMLSPGDFDGDGKVDVLYLRVIDATYYTEWVAVTVDPDGDGAAATSVGPGSLNLLTGDYTLSSTDVDELGLTVSRVASSREPADGWLPQGERLTPNQQQVGTDTTGFATDSTATIARSTARGQSSSPDSLEITPTAGNADSYATLGCGSGLCHTMAAGKRYRLTAWIYVPTSTGLNGELANRGLRLVAFYQDGAGLHEVASPKAAWTDGWQELSVDLALPVGMTAAYFRLYNGMAGGSGKKVYYDNISLRELVAPFGPSWRGGVADAVAGSDYTTLEFPEPNLAEVKTVAGGSITFGKSSTGQFFPAPGAEMLTLTMVDANTYDLADVSGTTVRFTKPTGAASFTVTSTWTTEDKSTTSYTYDTTDNRTLVSRVASPAETGVVGCTAAAPTVPGRGCEVLEYVYATATTATSSVWGDIKDQVAAVKLWTWDPAGNGGAGAETAVDVVRYLYDDQRRLREVFDPRLATPLKTLYSYDTAGRATTLTPSGELPWMFDYGTIAAEPGNAGRLHRVRRAALLQGSATVPDGEIASRVVYQVPLTRAAGGPNDMNAAAITTWGQTDLPTDATAIFGPEDDPTVVQAGTTTPGADGYRAATVHYLNASAQEVNTASPHPAGVAGASIDTMQYDKFGNTIWTLQATNRLLALGQLPNAATMLAELNLSSLTTAARSQALATINKYSVDGLDLLETTGPSVKLVLDAALADPDGGGPLPALPSGSTVVGRSHTVNVYDENKPGGAAYHLVTTSTQGAAVAGYPDADTRTTTTGYSAASGGTSGWVLKKPTRITADAGPGGVQAVSNIVYNDQGRTTSSWGIDSNGSDARTSVSIYYTAGTNTVDAACGNKPEWAGQPCVTKKAGPATGHDPARMTTNLPERRVTSYTRWGDVATVTEAVPGTAASRTTTTHYDNAGRVDSVAITSTGDGATQLPATTTEYSPTTGQVTATHAGSATVGKEYDLLGRLYRYTDADGGVTTNEFDRYGKPAKVTDPTGWATFAYDRAAEPRGLLTSVTDSIAGTFRADYSADGQLTTLHYPNGMTRVDTLNANLEPTARVYQRDSDSTVIYSESLVDNSAGELINHTFTGGSRTYTYDRLGRLTAAADTNGTSGCTTRTYAYDNRTNRLARSSFNPATGGACQTTSAATSETHTYDTADRITDTGYTYDAFGRVTTVPGGLTNAYHANDLVASQQLGTSRQTWNLDPNYRIRAFTTDSLIGGNWSNATSKLNHYGDDSDEIRWIIEDTTLGSLTRMVSGPDGDLVATTSATGNIAYQITNLHGDVVTTVDTTLIPSTYQRFDEFGNAAPGQADTRYGWLGGKQRSAEALGDVILMGVRLYLPTTGRFLQTDPVDGGSATAYDYCAADPVNCTDLDGKSLWSAVKSVAKVVAPIAAVAAIIPGPIGAAAAGLSAAAYAVNGQYLQAAMMAATAAAAMVGAGAIGPGLLGTRLATTAGRVVQATKTVTTGRGPGVYIGITSRLKVYVGQSGNIANRFFGPKGHVAQGKFGKLGALLTIKIPVRGGKTAREVVEQRVLDRLGGVTRGYIENVVNPVGGRPELLKTTPMRWHKLW